MIAKRHVSFLHGDCITSTFTPALHARELQESGQHPGLQRCQQQVLGQGVSDACGRSGVNEPIEDRRSRLTLRSECLGGMSLHRLATWHPDPAEGVIPDGLGV
jgi:hypothetical protein